MKFLISTFFGILLIFSLSLVSCQDDFTIQRKYETEYVVLLIVDGPRHTETWGEPNRTYIPYRSQLLSEGVLVDNFRNNGVTFTSPGHASMVTGTYQNIANNGSELPTKPTLFQYLRKQNSWNDNQLALVTSKDKLHVLRNSSFSGYQDLYLASFNCGVNSNGTGGYRNDSITFEIAKQTLQNNHPYFTLISFKEPDVAGHLNDSAGYYNGIVKTDFYVNEIWNQIQADPIMAGKTTLIVTNDHGRHLDNAGGYVNHGDGCEGCRRIEFFALSPDFKQNYISTKNYEQIDIAHTIAELFHIKIKEGDGEVMWDLFK